MLVQSPGRDECERVVFKLSCKFMFGQEPAQMYAFPGKVSRINLEPGRVVISIPIDLDPPRYNRPGQLIDQPIVPDVSYKHGPGIPRFRAVDRRGSDFEKRGFNARHLHLERQTKS